MVDNIPFWGCEVDSIGSCYDPEGDVVILIPFDEDGKQFEEVAFAIDPDCMKRILKQMSAEYKGIMDVRRAVRKARKKGISAEEVLARFRAEVVADDIDEALRIQSREVNNENEV